ncbi:MAG: MauE/DoxX family redox-associated membrane protein [Bacillota bacterium]
MILVVLRVLLALIYLYAGGSKVFEPMLFQAVLQNYFPIPDSIALGLAIVVPWIQIIAALSVLMNWKTLYSSGLLTVMSLFFFSLMVVNYGQALPFGCGCFGFKGEELVGVYHVARDFSITILAGLVFYLTYRKESLEKRKMQPYLEY